MCGTIDTNRARFEVYGRQDPLGVSVFWPTNIWFHNICIGTGDSLIPNSRPSLLLSSEGLGRITVVVSDQNFQEILEDSSWEMRIIRNFMDLSKKNIWKDRKLGLISGSIKIGKYFRIVKKNNTFWFACG